MYQRRVKFCSSHSQNYRTIIVSQEQISHTNCSSERIPSKPMSKWRPRFKLSRIIMKFTFQKNTSVGLFERAAKAVCFPILKGAKPVSERRTWQGNFFRADLKRCWTRSFMQNGVCVRNVEVLKSGILFCSCPHTRLLNTDNLCDTVLSSFRCQTLNFIFREIPEKTFVLSSFQTAQNTNAWRVYVLYFVYPSWEKGENQLLEQNLHIA